MNSADKRRFAGILAIFAVGILAAVNSSNKPPAAATETKPVSPCTTDWTKCTDNSDMANNFKGWFDVKYDCKKKAADLAKYGTPDFPWLFYFSSFMPGSDYASGIVTVVEKDAKFQNGFGAMVRSRVICTYNLRTKTVIDVNIVAR